jgi:spermidine synthase
VAQTRLPAEPVTLSETGGIRYLHLGTPWIQGAMRIRDPSEIYLEYSQQMMAWLLFLQSKPKMQIAQLGLGTGSLAKFTLEHCPGVINTAVELNPAVIIAARTMFDLPHDHDQLRIVQDDALSFVKNKRHHQQFDVLQVDLYDADAKGPALSSLEFYKGCFYTLKATAVMTVNLFSQHKSFDINLNNMCKAFKGRVLIFPESHDCNAVAIAFKGPMINANWKNIEQRAKIIHDQTGLPTKSWAKGLQAVNARQEERLQI